MKVAVPRPTKVAVLGGGPSGAFAAEKLAAAGIRTIVFDEKLAWEKPCGGGLTWKAYSQYPFLTEGATPKKLVTESVLTVSGSPPARLKLDHPILIYSRYDLNAMLLDRAQTAGAQLERTRVLGADRTDNGWHIRTKNGTVDADFCLLAAGARNPLRNLGTELTPGDSMTALGYFVPAERDHIDIQFFAGLAGYIWIFPRCGHLSVGICGKEPAASLRARLERYMEEQGISKAGATYYGHLLPSLEPRAWQQNRVAGDRWMAVGDAAGLVDPITGEGLYYALRSAELAAQAITSESLDAYPHALQKDISDDLEFASRLADHFYHGKFLGGAVATRMIQFTRLSPTFRSLMQDLFAGTQPYLGLRERVFGNLSKSLREIAWNKFTPNKGSVSA
jgi:flavin-dependent dehydrogenase